MKIAYLDFNEDDLVEDYSHNNCKRYGGGRVFASIAKEKDKNFHIFSNEKSFVNLTDEENKENCHPLSSSDRYRIRSGEPIKNIISNADTFDIFVHHQSMYNVNVDGLKAKECCWAVSVGEYCHPHNKRLLLYNDLQNPNYGGPIPKLYKITIGKPIPDFQEYQKEDYIFQCTRHTREFGSIKVASLCKQYNIPVIFAGPIDNNYPLLDYVDGKLVKYVGTISDKDKFQYLKSAKFCTFIHGWPTPFNLSAIEALSYGTPLIATPVGFWKTLINGSNGAIVNNNEEFVQAYNSKYKQRDCWESSLPYSQENMISSFYTVFKQIYEEN